MCPMTRKNGDSDDSVKGESASRQGGGILRVLLVCLLFAAALGCNGGQGAVDEEQPRRDAASVSSSDSEEAVGPTEGAVNGVSAFPQHDAPLGTDNGGDYWAGRLVLDDGMSSRRSACQCQYGRCIGAAHLACWVRAQ